MTGLSDRKEAHERAEALLQYVHDASDGLMTPEFIHLADASDVVASIQDVAGLLAVVERYENALWEIEIVNDTIPPSNQVLRQTVAAMRKIARAALAGTEESADDGLTPIATPWRNT